MSAQQFRQTLREELGFPIDHGNLRVRAGQLRARMQMYPVVVGSQALLEPLFVWLMWNQDPFQKRGLVLWLVAMYALHAVEMLTWWRHRSHLGSVEACRSWRWRFNLFTLAVGLAWGSLRSGC